MQQLHNFHSIALAHVEITRVKVLVVLKVTQVGCEISVNTKRPSNNIYAAKDACVRAGKISFGYKVREVL